MTTTHTPRRFAGAAPAEALRAPAALGILARDAIALLVMVLVLSCTYDKSGLVFGTTSVSFYKVLFFVLVAACVLDPFRRRPVDGFAPRTWRVLIGFVVVQTLASLAGAFLIPMPWSPASEAYYLIQRASFVVVPWAGWRYGISEPRMLRLLAAAVVIHYLFVLIQFVSPPTYARFVESVFNILRPDNSRGWSGWSLNFIGLQRTAGYGAFASAFGFLFLAFAPRSPARALFGRMFVVAAALIAVLSGSRSVFLMTVLAGLAYARRTGQLRNLGTYFKWGILAAVLAGFFLTGVLTRGSVGSFDAFFSEERIASTLGKISNAQYGWTLFQRSPLVGYGQRRFADLTYSLGNENVHQAESHSFVLSTVLSSGLIGFFAYVFAAGVIVRRLWHRPGRDAAVVCAFFVGLNLYNITYDAGALDLFACFNGIAAYYALTSPTKAHG